MTTDFSNEISDAIMLFMGVFNKAVLSPSEMARDLPVGPSHIKTIFYLIRKGSTPISQVAKDLGISKPNMTPIIDKLVSEGYVNRFNDPNDRRIINVEATTKASELHEMHKENLRANMRSAISSKISTLQNEDLIELDESLKKITTILNKLV
jgi:DNA-binding MarR family transcriptional regulator